MSAALIYPNPAFLFLQIPNQLVVGVVRRGHRGLVIVIGSRLIVGGSDFVFTHIRWPPQLRVVRIACAARDITEPPSRKESI